VSDVPLLAGCVNDRVMRKEPVAARVVNTSVAPHVAPGRVAVAIGVRVRLERCDQEVSRGVPRPHHGDLERRYTAAVSGTVESSYSQDVVAKVECLRILAATRMQLDAVNRAPKADPPGHSPVVPRRKGKLRLYLVRLARAVNDWGSRRRPVAPRA